MLHNLLVQYPATLSVMWPH